MPLLFICMVNLPQSDFNFLSKFHFFFNSPAPRENNPSYSFESKIWNLGTKICKYINLGRTTKIVDIT